MRRAIFLDRDGTLNKPFIKNGLPFSPPSFNEFEILPGVKESLLKLKKLNFVCLLITNQPDVSRGKIKKKTVIQMNNFLKREVKLDDIFVCYHDNHNNCECRKPKPGMLIEAKNKHNIDMKQSWIIGDKEVDIDAANAVGIYNTILVRSGHLIDESSF